MATETQYKLRIPNAANREVVRTRLIEDEDFRISKIKLGTDEPPRFTIPAPTEDDPDNILSAKGFTAVVVAARPNFFKDKNKPEEEPKERRALYIVRAGTVNTETGKTEGGSYLPDLIYASPSSLRPWKEFCALLSPKFPNMKSPVVAKGTPYQHVLVRVTGTRVKTDKFTWNKLEFTPVRVLDEKEIAWITELIPMVEGSIRTYETNDSLDAAEDDVVYGGAARVADDSGDHQEAHSKAAAAAAAPAADDDEAPNAAAAAEAKKKAAAAKKKADAEAAAAAKLAEEQAAAKVAPVVPADDDADDSTPAVTPPKAATTSADDDADAPPPPARRRSVAMPDDDD